MGRTARSRPARLAEKLLQIRVSLGLSQNDMIRRLGLSDTLYQSNISGFELSEREPSLPILLRYAQVAGVYVDVLIDDQLDLPMNLPCQEKNSGIMRSTSKNKKK